MLSLLPVRTLPLTSELPPAAVADLLRGSIGDGPAAPFSGAVSDDGFVVTRLREYRAGSMPLLRGCFAPARQGGTDVRLRLRPPNTVVVFMGVWLGFLSTLAALILVAHAQGGRSLLLLLLPGGLAASSWVLMLSVFAADARWAIESLVTAVPALQAAGRPQTADHGAPVTTGTCPPDLHL